MIPRQATATLQSLAPGYLILDEVQRCPTLFSYLQTPVDANQRMAEFVLIGSQQFSLRSRLSGGFDQVGQIRRCHGLARPAG